MARHTATDSPVRVAGWVWAALIALIALVALVVGWFIVAGGQDNDDAAASCIDGDRELTVWADPATEDLAASLVEDYNATDPVVRDRCINAVVETVSTAEAAQAYREGNPGVAPLWFPVGTGFITGLSGAPAQVPVVGTDTLVHHVPVGAEQAIDQAVTPPGDDSMAATLAAESAGVDVDPGDPPLQQALADNLSILTSEGLLGMPANPVGEVQFPAVAFGSSPAVEEDDSRAAIDFLSTVTDDDVEMITPETASPWLNRSAGELAGVDLG